MNQWKENYIRILYLEGEMIIFTSFQLFIDVTLEKLRHQLHESSLNSSSLAIHLGLTSFFLVAFGYYRTRRTLSLILRTLPLSASFAALAYYSAVRRGPEWVPLEIASVSLSAAVLRCLFHLNVSKVTLSRVLVLSPLWMSLAKLNRSLSFVRSALFIILCLEINDCPGCFLTVCPPSDCLVVNPN